MILHPTRHSDRDDRGTVKPYPNYKSSGVEWLGEVPGHWEVWKLRSILTETTERNRPDWPLLSVVREQGVILRDVTNKDENHNYVPDDLTNYKVVHRGQFAMNKMKAWQGSYGVSMHDGIVSPAYYVFDIRGVTGGYFHLAIRSKVYVPFLDRLQMAFELVSGTCQKQGCTIFHSLSHPSPNRLPSFATWTT